MTAYGVVITVLLISPWVVIGVIFVGAALGRLQRGQLLRSPTLRIGSATLVERPMSSAIAWNLSKYSRGADNA